MAKYKSDKLLDNLASDIRKILLQIEQLGAYSEDQLREKPAIDAWSVVEVVAHLNYYASHYVPAIEEKLDGHQTQANVNFQPGWLGNYFTKLMGPSSDGQVRNKMKTMKEAQPLATTKLNPKQELQKLTQYQYQLLNLIEIARSANLAHIRVPTSIAKFIRLKLGDTFRFVVAHQQRHFQQIDRVLSNIRIEA